MVKTLENTNINKILSNEFIKLVHNKRTEQSTVIQTDDIINQQIDQEVHLIDDVEGISHEVTTESEYYLQYCQNCFRKQNKH